MAFMRYPDFGRKDRLRRQEVEDMGHFLELGKQALGPDKDKVGAGKDTRIEYQARSSGVSAGIEKNAPDAYGDMVKSLLGSIQDLGCLQGMYPWLEKAEPKIYRDLDKNLPDEIDRLWTSNAPFDLFGAVLRRYYEVFKEASAAFLLAQLDQIDEESASK
jgi:hypothetical protein